MWGMPDAVAACAAHYSSVSDHRTDFGPHRVYESPDDPSEWWDVRIWPRASRGLPTPLVLDASPAVEGGRRLPDRTMGPPYKEGS
jgi:hypothetical protein